MVEATKTKKTAAKKPSTRAKKASQKSEGGFAVIHTGGKQYRVSPGSKLRIEKILGDHKEGDVVVFKEVLMKDDGAEALTLGAPTISGASVSGTILKVGRAPKVTVIKYKQKSRYFKKYGHRQPFFEVRIDSIA